MNVIQTNNAPEAIGPYSQAVVAGDMLYTSGQIALRPDGSLNDGDIEVQTRQVFANLQAIITQAGGDHVASGQNHRVFEEFRRLCKNECHLR